MNNTTITAQTPRHGGSLRARKGRRRAGMLIIFCAAVMGLPGLAQAQTSGRGCASSGGFNIQLIPSVNFTLGKLPPPGTEIYRTTTYVINYECYYFDKLGNAATVTPQLYALSDYGKLNDALLKAGLQLAIIVNGDESNPWYPNLIPGTRPVSETHEAGLPYTGTSGPRTVSIAAKLSVVNDNPPAARYPVPSATIFKLVPAYGAGSSSGPFITSSATRMQYVPQCIGDVSVDNLVQFDRVMAVTGYMGTLPQQHPFTVTGRINPSCAIGSLTAPASPDNAQTQFLMLLAAQFVLQGAGRLDDAGQSIILSNDDGVDNGLKMQILDADNANLPVTILPAPAPPSRADVGNFGQLVGYNPAAAVHTYTALLMPDPGKELKIGKYSTQVLVRVTYY